MINELMIFLIPEKKRKEEVYSVVLEKVLRKKIVFLDIE